MTIPVAIQPFHNLTEGSLDLFTGVFYIIRILSVGHGSIQPSTEDFGILEQNIYNPNGVDSNNVWYFEPASSSGLYYWRSASLSNATVMWESAEGDEEPEEHNEGNKSYPLILENLSEEINPEENPLVSSLWTLESHPLNEFGLTGTGYSMKSFNPSHTTGSVTLGSESSKGWWLQVDEQNPADSDPESADCDAECLRSKLNTLMIFEPTNFKLHADTNHMDLGEYSDILKQVKIRKQHLSNNITLTNPTETERGFNVSLDTIVEYDLFPQPEAVFQMFSTLTVFNPLTNPSMKYFNFEEGRSEDHNGKDMRLKATAYVKTIEEIDVEPFTKKTVSGYVTYIEEFGGIPYTSWTNVSAQIDTMKGQETEKTRWVNNSALLKHLVRSRGYQGQMREVQTSPGEPAKIAIKIRGTIRGKLPLPYIQFEEMSSSSTYSQPPTSPSPPVHNNSKESQDDNRVKPYSSFNPNPNKVVVGKKFSSHLS